MVSITISMDVETWNKVVNYAELENMKVSPAAAKLIRKGFAHEAQIRSEMK